MSFFSREFGFVAAMILLCLSSLVTGLGTSAPLITRVLEKASKVSTEFYVVTNLPLALVMLLLLSCVPLMAWGKNRLSKLGSKLIWAAVGAIVSAIVTLLNGYPSMEKPLLSAGVLVLSLVAGAVAGMNLRLAIRLVRKKIALSSGAIAHLGVGLMFLGIVSSSVYDRSEKVLLPQGTVKSAMGYDLEFNEPGLSRDGKGMRLHLPLNVKKGNSQFIAQPDIFSEPSRGNGQPKRFVHPHIQRGLVSDLYISPVDFQPGEKKSSGNEIVLKKGEKIQFHDYELSFTAFDVTGMMGQENAHSVSVGANIVVSHKGTEPVTLKPVLSIGRTHSPSGRVKLPGPQEAFLTLVSIDAGAKTIALVYDGPESVAEQAPERKPPAVIAEISIKPGMTLLWTGVVLILLGGSIGVARRWPK